MFMKELRALCRNRAVVVAMSSYLALSGCTGAGLKLPEVSDAEAEKAALAMHEEGEPLLIVERSPKEMRAMINRIHERLARDLQPVCERLKEEENCYFRIQFVNEPVVNAYASGSNEIVIYRGLVDYLETEDEVAAVVAHEMGHHLANHIEEATQNTRIGGLLGALIANAALAAAGYNPSQDPYGQGQDIVDNYTEVGAKAGRLSFSKEQERESDLIAAYLLARAGYDLEKAGRVWSVLAKSSKRGVHAEMTDTHPTGPERIVGWQKAIEMVEADEDKLPDE